MRERGGVWVSKITPHWQNQKPILIWRWCWVYGDIGKEFILKFRMINLNKYSQLGQHKTVINEKYPELFKRKVLIFYQDYIRIHIFLMNRQNLLQLDWKVSSYLLYSSDITSLDDHLFYSQENFYNWKKLTL